MSLTVESHSLLSTASHPFFAYIRARVREDCPPAQMFWLMSLSVNIKQKISDQIVPHFRYKQAIYAYRDSNQGTHLYIDRIIEASVMQISRLKMDCYKRSRFDRFSSTGNAMYRGKGKQSYLRRTFYRQTRPFLLFWVHFL